jgi:hypothetical protein
MVVRRQRATGEEFLGCTRYPECRGTRPLPQPGTRSAASRAPRRRHRLSSGGRYAKNLPEVVELLVARAIGRDLSGREGCAVQLIALLAFFVVVYWFFTSGLFAAIVTPIAEWYAHQFHFGPTPAPSPLPS